ncbi:hypothetical protein [Brevibacillus halotolerans]|uniref:hypothetical protein n=1 Tax=Brevibacillus halotolerans TaxID=1507437 RepID=UPI0015EFC0BD|nr:hypothetical protein [Brevibacillus halotolerans]MBA4535492.1 hypothetical protein [Brevibacillus halotolerans]
MRFAKVLVLLLYFFILSVPRTTYAASQLLLTPSTICGNNGGDRQLIDVNNTNYYYIKPYGGSMTFCFPSPVKVTGGAGRYHDGGTLKATFYNSKGQVVGRGYGLYSYSTPFEDVTKIEVRNDDRYIANYYYFNFYGETSPPEIKDFTALWAASDRVALKFSAERAATIEVYRDNEKIADLPGTSTGFDDTEFKPSTTPYKYKIIARNGDKQDESPVHSIRTASNAAIKDLKVTSKKKTAVSFAWSNVPEAEKYKADIKILRKETGKIETSSKETTSTSLVVDGLKTDDQVEVAVSLFEQPFGWIGTAKASAVVPGYDPLPKPGEDGNTGYLPTIGDIFYSIWSFASNFFSLVILSMCLFLVPYLFYIARQAVKPKTETQRSRFRAKARDIRMQVRGDK